MDAVRQGSNITELRPSEEEALHDSLLPWLDQLNLGRHVISQTAMGGAQVASKFVACESV